MRKAIIVIGIIIGVMLIPAGAAFADPGSHGGSTPASCSGIESSGISPKGSSDEFPGGRPELNAFLREAFPGVPMGAIISEFAKFHAGSHEGCDAE